MRYTLLLLAATAILSACADDQHPTAPSSRSNPSSRSVNGDAAPSGQAIALPGAKPVDQVGFTKITRVTSAATTLGASTVGVTADCPAGTVLTGGGFWFQDWTGTTAPFVTGSLDNGHNSWAVTVDNPGAASGTFYAFANCAS